MAAMALLRYGTVVKYRKQVINCSLFRCQVKSFFLHRTNFLSFNIKIISVCHSKLSKNRYLVQPCGEWSRVSIAKHSILGHCRLAYGILIYSLHSPIGRQCDAYLGPGLAISPQNLKFIFFSVFSSIQFKNCIRIISLKHIVIGTDGI